MIFTFWGQPMTPFLGWFAEGLRTALEGLGYTFQPEPGPDVRLVIQFPDFQRVRPYRRRSQATFVVSVVDAAEVPAALLAPAVTYAGAAALAPAAPASTPMSTPSNRDILLAAYPLLVRTLSNLLIYVSPAEEEGHHQEPVQRRFHTHFITPEQGCYRVDPPGGDAAGYFARVLERLLPVASSTLVIDNIFETDLPPDLWEGDEQVEQLRRAGKALDAMNLLPAPFPIDQILPPREWRHVQRLYSLGGLSYGNLSARKDASRFWMSASGINKADMRTVGEHILLVKGFDPQRKAMLLSVPPHVQPRRVSVDAIEHWMIYTEHPSVGAIVHVHAWMDGIPSTEINYPCGTIELARAVAELVRRSPDPSRAVIGLKNHGLTITGRSLDDIFERIEGRIIPQVPMS